MSISKWKQKQSMINLWLVCHIFRKVCLNLDDYGHIDETSLFHSSEGKLQCREVIVLLRGIHIFIMLDIGNQLSSYFQSFMQHELGTQLEISIIFHPQNDGQSEHTTQVLEDILHTWVLDINGYQNQFIPLVKFAYNNIYYPVFIQNY